MSPAASGGGPPAPPGDDGTATTAAGTPGDTSAADPGARVTSASSPRTQTTTAAGSRRRGGTAGSDTSAADAGTPTPVTDGTAQGLPVNLAIQETAGTVRMARPPGHQSGGDETREAVVVSGTSIAGNPVGSSSVDATIGAAPGGSAAGTGRPVDGSAAVPDGSTVGADGGSAPAVSAAAGEPGRDPRASEKGRTALDTALAVPGGMASPAAEAAASGAAASAASVPIATPPQTSWTSSEMSDSDHAGALGSPDRGLDGSSVASVPDATPDGLAASGRLRGGEGVEASFVASKGGDAMAVRVSIGAVGTIEVRVGPTEVGHQSAVTITTDKPDTLLAVMSDHSGIRAMLDQAGIEPDRTISYALVDATAAATGDGTQWTAAQDSDRGSGSATRERWSFGRNGDADGQDETRLDAPSAAFGPGATRSSGAGRAALNFTA